MGRRVTPGWAVGRRLAIGALAALVVGCQSVPGLPTRTSAASSAAASLVGSTGPGTPLLGPGRIASPSVPGGPGASPSPGGLGAIASLLGRVRAPASLLPPGVGLISDNGGGLISENGGSVISNNGARVLANTGGGVVSNNGAGLAGVPERALPHVTVRMLKADGAPVLTADGQPLTATTDDSGAYAFPSVPADHAVILEATLPGGGGTLDALAPRGSARIDLDTVSTYTSDYVVDQYVRTQQDPIATLDKLPADVEATTRAKAAAALAAGKSTLPDALSAAKVDAAVETLRKQDGGLDGQLELVKRLLVAVGQLDRGAGLPGTQVDLDRVLRLAIAPTGALAIVTRERVWALQADGTLVAAYDATDQAVGLADATYDGQGRLLVAEPAKGADAVRVVRLAPDGARTTVGVVPAPARGTTTTLGVVAGEGDDVLVATSTADAGGMPAAVSLWTLAPGQGATSRSLPAGPVAGPIGRDQAGTLSFTGPIGQVLALDPGAAGYRTVVTGGAATGPAGEIASIKGTIDARGDLLAFTNPDGGTWALTTRAPGAAPVDRIKSTTLAEDWEFIGANDAFVGALAADGTAYVTGTRYAGWQGTAPWKVFKIADGRATLVAGHDQPAAGTATTLALHEPTSVAVRPDGSWVIDDDVQLLSVGPNSHVATLASLPSNPFAWTLGRVRADGLGNVYTLRRTVVDLAPKTDLVRFAADGQEAVLDAGASLAAAPAFELAAGPDGTLAVLDDAGLVLGLPAHPKVVAIPGIDGVTYGSDNRQHWRRAGTGSTNPFPQADADVLAAALATDPTGQLYLVRDGEVDRVAADGTLVKVATAAFAIGDAFAVDARGRLYFGRAAVDHRAAIERLDPATGTLTRLAGPGTTHFAGSGVDDSLDRVADMAFAADGTLLVVDTGHRQVKRLPLAD